MSSTDRQNRLLVAEDWKRIYQSYRNADFQSYDFDNLRRTMINYLRENYPEDFNDYTESSEYIALIDMIAYLGQNLAFRTDLNARENFLELAERRESVLRLARLLSYNPKRNQAANGLLKVESVTTTEEIIDSNNTNLENQAILWNDPANPDWYEQFILIMNASLPVNGTFGRPFKKDTIAGVPTEQYRFNSTNQDVPVYSFNKAVNGSNNRFEIVSTDIGDGAIEEEAPFPGNNFAMLYRNDGRGNGSTNTGFFSHFRQGALDQGPFTITNPTTNQVVAIDAVNVNDTDVWLYKLDSNGQEVEQWTKVAATEGNNVIYNSLNKSVRNFYSVLTRVEDRISIVFSDGVFGNLPKGTFRAYYRSSKNQRMIITPDEMKGISIKIPYIARSGSVETLTLIYSLQYTVDNATVSETSASIKNNAPATYYTQNRMITAEDYQIVPLTISQEIVKTKSVNRTASGISRYFDLLDATGKYSKTNMFATDGVVYKDFLDSKATFTFSTTTDISGAINNTIQPILRSTLIKNFYSNTFPKIDVTDLNIQWKQKTDETNNTTGIFESTAGVKIQLGTFTSSTLQFVKPGSLVKFVAPAGKHFMADNSHSLMAGAADHPNAVTYKWSKVVSVEGDGTTTNDDGVGAVLLNDTIPTDAQLVEIRPNIATEITSEVQTQIIDQVNAYNTFGLRFDRTSGEWKLISEENLRLNTAFSIGKTGDVSGQKLDASWLLLFQTDGEKYTITYRGSRYVFESDQEVKFYYDSSDKIYNNLTGKTIKDKISVLSINKKPDSTDSFTVDFDWEIKEEFRDAEGYVNSKKIQVSFFDSDDDGVVDDPQIFEEIVDETTNPTEKYIFLRKMKSSDGVEDFNYVSNNTLKINIKQNQTAVGAYSAYDDGTVFYLIDEKVFKVLDKTASTLTITDDYKAKIGRDNLKFHYVHAADASTRIDPSASNIVDTYLLTRAYDTAFRQYLDSSTASKPLPPSSDALFQNFGSKLNEVKSISDEIIYHPVKYKILFGDKASGDLQAQFKIVKNPDKVINDNDVKSRVISAINEFFSLENWDFGETFYFSELSAYVMNQLAPDLTTFVIVPQDETQTFGSLYEIKSESDEIFISGAQVSDIDIIDAITASRLKAAGNVITESPTANAGITSTGSTTSSGTTTITYTTSSSSGSSSSGSGSGSSGGGGSYY